MALLTWVTSTASHRCDVPRLIAHGHRMGSIVGVDITQGVGLLPFSVACGADFVVSTSLKWLCGVPGAGIIYVAPSLLAECQPEFRGWFSQENPFSWDLTKFRFADDARRFDHGTPSIVSAVASLPGLRWLASAGIDTVREHNRALTERIIGHACERGWTVASPLNAEQRGGSVMITVPPGIDASTVVAALRSRHLYCDARGSHAATVAWCRHSRPTTSMRCALRWTNCWSGDNQPVPRHDAHTTRCGACGKRVAGGCGRKLTAPVRLAANAA